MKVYLILIGFLTLTFPSFSQTVIDTSYVILPNAVAKEIVKELTTKDFLEKEIIVYKKTIELYTLKLATNEQIISNLEKELFNARVTDQLYKAKEKIYIKEEKKLSEELEKEKRKFKLYRRLSYVSLFIVSVINLSK